MDKQRPRAEEQSERNAAGGNSRLRNDAPLVDNGLSDNIPYWTSNHVSPADRRSDLRNWLQTAGLQKSEDYTIDPDVQIIRVGIGWDKGADVDASAILFDEHLRTADTIWFKKLRSTCGSISHSGDNLTGIGEGDDEVITVALSEIPLHIHFVLFTVCVYSFAVSFSDIQSAYVRMMHGKEKYKHHEMCRFSLSDMSGHSMLLGLLVRRGPYWNFRTLGTPATGRTVIELLQNPRNIQCLSENPSCRPELRCITITVVKGIDLAAKDKAGFFKRVASSDPYFVIRFKNKRYTSEYKAQTLAPEWKAPPFHIGWIMEAETKPVKIEVFDYDAIGADDFMGVVRIPGYALFELGIGEHAFWFVLGDSKKKEYRNEVVSGRILINIKVEGQEIRSVIA